MFFIFGINQKREELDLSELKVCDICGAYGRYEAFMDYNAFSLFFIPIFKWNKNYYIKANCCGSIFSIPEHIGKDLEYGRQTTIRDEDMTLISRGYNNYENQNRECSYCGYPLEKDHIYCPRCGRKI